MTTNSKRYEVHLNTSTSWTKIDEYSSEKAARSAAVKLAAKLKPSNKMVPDSYGVYDIKRRVYLGFTRG